MRYTGIIPALCLLLATASHADHKYISIGEIPPGDSWQPTQDDMDSQTYERAIRKNRGLLVDGLNSRAPGTRTLDTMQLNFNERSPVKFILRDTTRSRRSLMLEYRKSW